MRRNHGCRVSARVARGLLNFAGWRVVGAFPKAPRCIVIFAPHTSNWDLPLMLLTEFALGRRMPYLAKHTLFRGPLGRLLRWTGGIPVDRSRPHHAVDTLRDLFVKRDEFWLALAPEGTRAKTDHWKSGFYRVAVETGVPVLLTFLDSRTKTCGTGKLLTLTGAVDADLEQIRAFYADKRGIRPELASEIRFLPA